ncbi:putative oxidoreductase, partial [Gordonia hirsuta DSM 44140 = NBRC 16056]
VRGVRVRGQEVIAGEVIVAAGTLGTAALLRRSGVLAAMGLDRVHPHEHPERLVRWQPVRPLTAPALLQSVVQSGGVGEPERAGEPGGAGEPAGAGGLTGVDGVEIRCYSDDFARFIGGPRHPDEPAGVPVGVADLAHPAVGTLDGRGLDLGEPDAASSARMARAVADVVQMLESPVYAPLVVPGSIRVDPVTGMSQHATGTLPLGRLVDDLGGVRQIRGLRVVDGSIIPGALGSGPHASIAMAAWLIAGAIA